jgi:hypothetical protein
MRPVRTHVVYADKVRVGESGRRSSPLVKLPGKGCFFNPVRGQSLDNDRAAQLKIESLEGSRSDRKRTINPVTIGNKLWHLMSPVMLQGPGFQIV